ncbi:STAS domain-containing protein [Streptomyces sp. NPDC001568]|uniref:STAS domain-containing protein n=1 Tax=Streptomyces sp. NPDC001568 TaxID=3364588 RepID=UPI003691336D
MTGDENEPVVTVTRREGIPVVHLHGDLDDDSAPAAARALGEAARSGAGRTVVDLSGTCFADSSILHILLEAQRTHAAAGLTLVLAGPLQPVVRRLFEVTGSGIAFRMTDSLETAMTC